MEALTEYELKLQKAFNDTCTVHSSSLIKDPEEWEYLLAQLLRLKLMSIKDQEKLLHFTPSFPCTF
jgi:hypothetical protein